MFGIETFTAHPDFVEDRIRFDAVNPDGGAMTIMLTRRLCDRFLPMFVQAVEQSVRPGIPREIELAMAQQQLRQARAESPTPDVVMPEGAASWLARTVHLEGREGGVLWTITDDGENAAAMALPGDGLRAVLDVFLLIYRHLEWDLALFPEWLREEPVPDTGGRLLN